MILLKLNHRIFPYHQVFGSTTDFSPNLFVGGDTLSETEPVGNENCTCFTFDKVKSGETGKKYDHEWLWQQLVKIGKASVNGAAPEDAFNMGCKGAKVVPTGEIETSPAYFQTDNGPEDFFTNVKSAIQLEYNKGFKRSIGVATYWYQEYNNTFPNGVLNMGIHQNGAHMWQIVGWDEAHPDCFKVDAHFGYYIYMPRDVFNHAMDATYGSIALTIAETTQEKIDYLKATNTSIVQKIIDFCYNLVKLIQTQKVIQNQIDIVVKKNLS